MLRKLSEARQARKSHARPDSSHLRASKPELQALFTHRLPSDDGLTSKPISHSHHLQSIASKPPTARPKSSVIHPADALTLEPLEPTHTTISGSTKKSRRTSGDQLAQIRAAASSRPKTSAAACVDYIDPSIGTSNSTSRSNTTHGGFGRPISTGLSSITSPPADEKKPIPESKRTSDPIPQDGSAITVSDTAANAWIAQELARRRAEQSSGRAARPTSRASVQPLSRAGSMAESVRDGLRDYIRSRASSDSLRSTQSDNALGRTSNRNSNKDFSRSENTWWRPRRKNSWNSFRSARPEEQQQQNYDRDGPPNLNRALPALPGLDQYKEKKAPPTHIAQLMRPNTAGGDKKSDYEQRWFSSATALDSNSSHGDNSSHHFLTDAERRQRLEQSRKSSVEQRMRHHAMMASANFGLHSEQVQIQQAQIQYVRRSIADRPSSEPNPRVLRSSTEPSAWDRRQQDIAATDESISKPSISRLVTDNNNSPRLSAPAPEITDDRPLRTEGKKLGLRKRLSRFFHRADRARRAQSMVATH